MIYLIKVIDYKLFYEESVGYFEGDAKISINNIILSVFIPAGFKFLNLLGENNMRGKVIEVDLQIGCVGIIKPVGAKKKLLLEITYRDAAPNYLFIGQVLKKEDLSSDKGHIVFDCGIVLEVDMEKDYFYNQLEVGEYILVIGRPDIVLVDKNKEEFKM